MCPCLFQTLRTADLCLKYWAKRESKKGTPPAPRNKEENCSYNSEQSLGLRALKGWWGPRGGRGHECPRTVGTWNCSSCLNLADEKLESSLSFMNRAKKVSVFLIPGHGLEGNFHKMRRHSAVLCAGVRPTFTLPFLQCGNTMLKNKLTDGKLL